MVLALSSLTYFAGWVLLIFHFSELHCPLFAALFLRQQHRASLRWRVTNICWVCSCRDTWQMECTNEKGFHREELCWLSSARERMIWNQGYMPLFMLKILHGLVDYPSGSLNINNHVERRTFLYFRSTAPQIFSWASNSCCQLHPYIARDIISALW